MSYTSDYSRKPKNWNMTVVRPQAKEGRTLSTNFPTVTFRLFGVSCTPKPQEGHMTLTGPKSPNSNIYWNLLYLQLDHCLWQTPMCRHGPSAFRLAFYGGGSVKCWGDPRSRRPRPPSQNGIACVLSDMHGPPTSVKHWAKEIRGSCYGGPSNYAGQLNAVSVGKTWHFHATQSSTLATVNEPRVDCNQTALP